MAPRGGEEKLTNSGAAVKRCAATFRVDLNRLGPFRLIYPLAFFCAIAASCSPSKEKPEASIPVSRVEQAGPVQETKALLHIGGMTCEAGCGGKIRQELEALDGVDKTNVDFAEGRKSNVITVWYDPERLSEQALEECVNGIADGRYQVASMEIQTIRPSQGTSSSAMREENESGLNFARFFRMFDLLNSVSRLVPQ